MRSGIARKYATHVRSLHRAEDDGLDALALAQLAPLGGGPLPWTVYSMRPAAIAGAVSDVLLNGRRTIVECGSGNSTMFLARALRTLGEGRIVSIDHDARWSALTRGLLVRDGLGDRASVLDAPLVDGWYDREAIPAIDGIDLLVIDGPPAHTDESGEDRYPALGFFADRLGPGATVLVDDANRPGEQAVMARWEREYGLAFTRQRGGFALARS